MTPAIIADELSALARSGDYARMISTSARIASRLAITEDPERLVTELVTLGRQGPIAALMAIESLVGIQHSHVEDALVDLLGHPEKIVRRHATWRLGDRQPTARALPALVEMLMFGGIDTMHAHRTLRRWSRIDAGPIVRLVERTLATTASPPQRARLIDLLGVIDTSSHDVLLNVALDEDEAMAARTSAIGALGEMDGDRVRAALSKLALCDDAIGATAALALTSHTSEEPPRRAQSDLGGLRIAQLVLVEGLDGQLSLGGKGDTGGVASLLVSLGEALSARPDVDHVLTIGRGNNDDVVTGPLSSSRSPLSFGMVAFGDDSRPAQTPDEVWEHLPTIERSLRRILRRSRPTSLLHLRMADAGTLAGAEVAAELGIPICFSVAPDPHNVIDSMQARGQLDDESFLRLITDTHVWFRARMVEQLTHDAQKLALFPRSRPVPVLDTIVEARPSDGVALVAEGIDLRLLERAMRNTETSPGSGRQGDVLDDVKAQLHESRRHLPLALTIGRLNPVKGMDRVVAAWASDPQLHGSCNLVIVGGDLDHPSTTERSVLAEIERLVPIDDPRRAGLVLLGGRPRAEVARLQVAAMTGRPGAWSGGGIYVDGALKEEFGLAVLEGLAVGLVVVAPSTGGPSTYVDHGDTGVLVDPTDDLARAMHLAFGLVGQPGRAARARAMVEERYSIDTMAAQLVDLYRPAMALQ